MHPRIAEAKKHLAENHAKLKAAYDVVPAAARDARLSKDRWSVAEVIEHCATVEKAVTKLFAFRLQEAVAGGLRKDPDSSSLWEQRYEAMFLDRNRRVNAPERSHPSGALNAEQAWHEHEAARLAFIAVLDQYDGYALQDLTFPHPLIGELNFYQWVYAAGWHEARHALQIREMISIDAAAH